MFLEAYDPGVAGVRLPWREPSVFCLSRFRPSRSPKLLRPVEDEVRVVPGYWWSSTEGRPNELIVDDRPLRLICDRVGDDCPDWEPGRNKAVAGDAEGFPKKVELREGEAIGVLPPWLVEGRGASGVREPPEPAEVESRGARDELEAVG